MTTEADFMERIILVAHSEGWKIRFGTDSGGMYAELGRRGSAGREGFSFRVWYQDARGLALAVKAYCENFDEEGWVTERLVEKWKGRTDVPGVKALMQRARRISSLLDELVHTLKKMVSDDWYSVIDSRKAEEIIDTRLPAGRFIHPDNGVFIGIDNLTKDAWTEEFDSEARCLLWLSREAGGYERCLYLSAEADR